MPKGTVGAIGTGGECARPGPVFWLCMFALGSAGAAASHALFDEPAFAFLRAIKSVPWTAWDARVAYGLVLVALVGLQGLWLHLLGVVAAKRLMRYL